MNLEHIQKFLNKHGWTVERIGDFGFYSVYPPAELNLPDGYYLDVPHTDENQKYAPQLIKIFEGIYGVEYIRVYFNKLNN
jgi:hypothetical protein